MTSEDIKQLAERIATGTASEEDILRYNALCNEFAATGAWDEALYGDRAALEASMKKVIFQRAGIRRPLVRLPLFRWSAVAAAVLLLGSAAYFLSVRQKTEVPVAKAPLSTDRFKNDVAPGQQGAILTLSNGQTIVLDSAANGALAQEGAAKVIKEGGQIVYKDAGAAGSVVYNTMTTPRGRQYNLLLADGTHVWLNAASSITYPTAFTGGERRVRITGEAYFEVAHRDNLPFVVQKDDVQVQVLGTHFNVNAYEGEPSLDVTLLEGAVRVVKGGPGSRQVITGSGDPGRTVTIRPGQQAQVKGEGVKVVDDADLEAVMAWKNGYFRFGGASIETLMGQLARWYDVEIEYRKKVNERFYAEIPRDTKLSDALKALELTGEVRFGIEGKKVIVMP